MEEKQRHANEMRFYCVSVKDNPAEPKQASTHAHARSHFGLRVRVRCVCNMGNAVHKMKACVAVDEVIFSHLYAFYNSYYPCGILSIELPLESKNTFSVFTTYHQKPNNPPHPFPL